MKKIKTQSQYFIDQNNKKVFFRGVNLGGSSKVPFNPNGATYIRDNFFNHLNVSFIGRPFPIEEADEHFSRLKKWGFNFLRLITTWEAIEHCGPGIYDIEYLDYFEQIVKKAGEYDFTIFIDPHQDVWSRFTGGDGAPGWTLELAGFDIKNLHPSGAAIVHNVHGDPFPKMIWPTNNHKLAAGTMFTLFFGGKDFAPNFQIAGVQIQDYLQDHYINSILQLVKRLKKYDHVIGYDSLNEPSHGWIGYEDLRKNAVLLKLGEMPTPWQSILLGDGRPQEVEIWKIWKLGLRLSDWKMINQDQVRAWQKGVDCVWKQHGVWTSDDKDKPVLINPFYFSEVNGTKVNFNQDYLKPFINKFSKSVQTIDPDALIFIEGVPENRIPSWNENDATPIVNATHWYDGVTLLTKNFNPNFTMDTDSMKLALGKKKVQKVFFNQLNKLKIDSKEKLGDVPTILGEFGVPFDLNKKKSFKSGDFSLQASALDSYYQIIEELFLDSTIWNYTADNTNQRGDLWNDEDLSIFSRDQQVDPSNIHSGGRALSAIVRPYLRSIEGDPVSQSFNYKRKEYSLIFKSDIDGELIIFTPDFQFPRGFRVEFTNGTWESDQEKQELVVKYSANSEDQILRILPL
ncbi:MAG TPA: cellulase family glycosylhydrolase [Anaerolineaceae bacterium]|nr:cellulase family glycosylhydrolase [Anaerolineaceae bacterium]